MTKKLKVLCSGAALLLCSLLLLAGCSSDSSSESLNVILGAPYVNEDSVAAYSEALSEGKTKPVIVQAYSFGSEKVDPTAFGASAMKISAMIAGKEIDVMVCDLENAARYARGESFYDLTSIFAAEELAPYADKMISFDMVDENGNPTGEKTATCGIDITGHENLSAMMGKEPYGIFIVANTTDLELSKAVVLEIVNS